MFPEPGRSQSKLPPSGPLAFTEIAAEKEELFLGSPTPEATLRAQDLVLPQCSPRGWRERGGAKPWGTGPHLPQAQAGRQGEGDVRGRKGPRGQEEETHVGKEAPPLEPESGGRGV